jgi:peroxiredoxin
MKRQYALTLSLSAILIIGLAAISGSGSTGIDVPAPPAIGAMIDDFKLPDTDGTDRSLKSLTGKHGAVLIFISVQCPVSNGYNERMEKLAQDYKAKGVNVIGINANGTESAEAVKAHAAAKGFTFTVLKDDGNKIADRLGATRTPEAYVIDASGKLVYHGRIDNSQNTEKITANDLRNALDEMIAGKQITKTGGAAFGCTIKRVGV